MPCLLGCIALFTPRLVIVLLVIFSDYIGTAYTTWIWPLLGFFFFPFTTLAYAWAWHMAPAGSISGFGIVVIVIAVLMDLGTLGGGASNKQVRAYYVRSR